MLPAKGMQHRTSKVLCLLALASSALAQEASFQSNLKKNEDSLAKGQPAPIDPLESQIIKEAPVALLTGGVGDVSIFGVLVIQNVNAR